MMIELPLGVFSDVQRGSLLSGAHLAPRRQQSARCTRDLTDAQTTLDCSHPEGFSLTAVHAAEGVNCLQELGREVLAPCVVDVASFE